LTSLNFNDFIQKAITFYIRSRQRSVRERERDFWGCAHECGDNQSQAAEVWWYGVISRPGECRVFGRD